MAKTRKSDEFEQTRVTLSKVKDYQACEFYFDQEHNTKKLGNIKTSDAEKERYEQCLRDTVFQFFHEKQSDYIMSFEELLAAWEKRWFPQGMTAEDLMSAKQKVRRTNLKDFSNVAVSALRRLHDEFVEDEGIPVLIDEDVHFTHPSRPDIMMTFRQHLLLLDAPKVYRSYHFLGRRSTPSSIYLMEELAMMHESFVHHHDPDVAVSFHILNVGRDGGIQVNTPTATRRDIDALYTWAERVADAGDFVPRRGFSTYCIGCKFDQECLEWEPNEQ